RVGAKTKPPVRSRSVIPIRLKRRCCGRDVAWKKMLKFQTMGLNKQNGIAHIQSEDTAFFHSQPRTGPAKSHKNSWTATSAPIVIYHFLSNSALNEIAVKPGQQRTATDKAFRHASEDQSHHNRIPNRSNAHAQKPECGSGNFNYRQPTKFESLLGDHHRGHI